MDRTTPVDGGSTAVTWRRIQDDAVSQPIVQQVSYLELKLEHPDLDPGGHGADFFPDAVPYELQDTPRVFYWRPALAPRSGDPDEWELACASTHELVGIDTLPSESPALVTESSDATTVVVDGTVAGEVRTRKVRSYTAPRVVIEDRTDSGIELTVAGSGYTIPVGDRRRIRLARDRVYPADGDAVTTTPLTPELVVRFPGHRELHHPAGGAEYRVFPSFGLDLDAVPDPLAIPTTAGELDEAALATDLGVDLSQRPYPERVLWQAFSYTAFDPHGGSTPGLAQPDRDHVVVRPGKTD